jgi:hypothetical protein
VVIMAAKRPAMRCPLCRSRRTRELADSVGAGDPLHECAACGRRWTLVLILDGPLAFLTPWTPPDEIRAELAEAEELLAATDRVFEPSYRRALRRRMTDARHILAGT